MLATPLQMALVASTIANGGRLVLPQAVLRVQAPGGRVIQQPQPDVAGQPISPQTAATMTELMRRVVDEGTGQAAQIGSLQVAGKTGTAQTGRKDATARSSTTPGSSPSRRSRSRASRSPSWSRTRPSSAARSPRRSPAT